MIARTAEAQTSLSRQLMARTMGRQYLAVCVGVMTGGGTIDAPIGRNRKDRLRMAVRESGRRRSRITGCWSGFAPIPFCPCNWRPGAPTKSACTCRMKNIPSSAIPLYGGRFAQPRGAAPALYRHAASLQTPGSACGNAGIRSSAHARAIDFAKPRAGGFRPVAPRIACGCKCGAVGARERGGERGVARGGLAARLPGCA